MKNSLLALCIVPYQINQIKIIIYIYIYIYVVKKQHAYICIYIYIYISAVKNNALTQLIQLQV